MLLEIFLKLQVIIVNLLKILLVDLAYIQMALPIIKPTLVTNEEGLAHALAQSKNRLMTLSASNNHLIHILNIALSVKIASMQEMNYNNIK